MSHLSRIPSGTEKKLDPASVGSDAASVSDASTPGVARNRRGVIRDRTKILIVCMSVRRQAAAETAAIFSRPGGVASRSIQSRMRSASACDTSRWSIRRWYVCASRWKSFSSRSISGFTAFSRAPEVLRNVRSFSYCASVCSHASRLFGEKCNTFPGASFPDQYSTSSISARPRPRRI